MAAAADSERVTGGAQIGPFCRERLAMPETGSLRIWGYVAEQQAAIWSGCAGRCSIGMSWPVAFAMLARER